MGNNADSFPNDPTRTENEQANNIYTARYVRLSAFSEINGLPYTNAAEVNLLDSNGQALNRTNWTASANSQEFDGLASFTIDGNNNSIWHTEWRNQRPSHTHQLTIDMGSPESITALTYLPRQDAQTNGNIASYEIHLSDDGVSWGVSVTAGTLSGRQLSTIEFPAAPINPTLDSDGDGVP